MCAGFARSQRLSATGKLDFPYTAGATMWISPCWKRSLSSRELKPLRKGEGRGFMGRGGKGAGIRGRVLVRCGFCREDLAGAQAEENGIEQEVGAFREPVGGEPAGFGEFAVEVAGVG